MTKTILEITNLQVGFTEDKIILDNINLKIQENEIHILMGPNGCGKSTLSKVLAGHPSIKILKGKILFNEKEIISLLPENRSHEGLFLAFQYPLEITGVSTYDFLRIAYNEKRKYFNQEELDPIQFMIPLKSSMDQLKIKENFLKRNLNEGFSGGEKKRMEILQMLLLEPKLIILDEIDSGLDIDAIKLIYQTILQLKTSNSSILLVTHYPQILEYVTPTYVHLMIDGKILKTGNENLLKELLIKGYDHFFETELTK